MTSESEQDNNQEATDSTSNALDTLKGTLKVLANERQRPVLLLNGPMDELRSELGRIIAPAFGRHRQLSVLLNSPGGSARPTYKMILALRQHVDDIEVLVPRRAKSAATFFCLGADTIYMGTEGELGPLDPQIRDRTGRGRRISALESFKALEQLLEHSLDSFDAIVRFLRKNTHMDTPHAIEQANPLFAAIVSPLYQQIDPHELGEMGRYLSEIEEYALRLMDRWSYASRDEEDREQIVRSLVWEYPSHGFVIDLDEAREIGLNAKTLDDKSEALCIKILNNTRTLVWFEFPDEETEQPNSYGDPSSCI